MTTNILPAGERLIQAVQALPEDLRPFHKRAMAILHEMQKNSVLHWYDLGVVLNEAARTEHGELAVDKIWAAASPDLKTKTYFWASAQFARRFKREYVEAMLQKLTAGGRRLRWAHFRELARVENGADRKALIQKTLTEDLSTTAIQAEVHALLGGKRSKGGRKLVSPKSMLAAAAQMTKYMDLVKRKPLWQKTLFDRLATAGPADVDKRLLKQLEEAKVVQEQVATAAGEETQLLSQAITRVMELLSRKDQPVEVDDAHIPQRVKESSGTASPAERAKAGRARMRANQQSKLQAPRGGKGGRKREPVAAG